MTTMTTASRLETSFKFKCELQSPAKTRLFYPANCKHVVRSLRAWRIRCASDDPENGCSVVHVQILSPLLPPNGMATESDIYPWMQNEIRKVVTKGGINGSIAYELERPENTGLKKSKVLQKAKIKVDEIQPVSWADMISVAGSEAVSICGGPTIPVALGRLDSTQPDPEDKLPPETLSATGLKECFIRKGFSTQVQVFPYEWETRLLCSLFSSTGAEPI